MLINNINKTITRKLFGLSGIFYFLVLFLPATACYCQQNSTGKRGPLFQLVNRQVDSYLGNDFLLMNAKIHINKFQRAKGKPYFETTIDTAGTLVLGKREYNNIQLLYDIYDQKLFFIAENARNKGTILELNNQVITRFYLDDKI